MSASSRFGRERHEPPPRAVSAEMLKFRENFDLKAHLSQQGSSENSQSRPDGVTGQVFEFNEAQIRENLRQMGLDMQIFPIGEKPADPGGYATNREEKIVELERENKNLTIRAKLAEQSAADSIRELKEVNVQLSEANGIMESLKNAAKEATSTKESASV